MIRLFETHTVRPQRDLSGHWKLERLSDSGEVTLTSSAMVPSCWEGMREWESFRGRGRYTKEITTAGGNLRLAFGGVSHSADVFWDSEKIAHHYNAFTPFEAILTDVPAGTHTLTVIADNRFSEDSALHVPNDYRTYGGITRPVALEELGDTYIHHIHVTPVRGAAGWTAQITAEIRRLSGSGAAALRLHLADTEITEPLTYDENGIAAVHRNVTVPDARPWSPEEPHLYSITAVLTDEDGHTVDDLIERFGFREIRADGTKILLNGRQLLVKGFNRHEDYGTFGCAVPESAMNHDLEIIRSTGANLIRTCHYPNDQRFLDLCDEYGMLVWEEAHARGLTLKRMENPNFRRQSEVCIAEMVEAHYNHPSIVFWGILNECASETEYGRDCYALQFEQLRTLDKTRLLTTATCKHFSDLTYGMPDVVSLNVYPQWYSDSTPIAFFERVKAYLDEHGGAGKPILISECGAGAVYGYRAFSEVKWSEDYQAKLLAELIESYTTREDISGIILWQYADCRVDDEWFASRPKTQNNKGIVDMYRRPKMGYYTVRDAFAKLKNYRDENVARTDRTERCELTVLCLLRDGSRILLQKRVKADWRGYTLPGGHIEPGESVTDAVIREMREETGLTVPHPRLCGVKQFPIDGGRYLVFLFTADEFTGELRSSEEGAIEWVEREAVPHLPAVKDFAELLAVMEREDLTEFRYVPRGEKWGVEVK